MTLELMTLELASRFKALVRRTFRVSDIKQCRYCGLRKHRSEMLHHSFYGYTCNAKCEHDFWLFSQI